MDDEKGKAEKATPNRAKSPLAAAIFLAVCALVVLLPSVGMLWAPTSETSENRALAEVPSLTDEDGVNLDFLSELGTCFEDHFAYRSQLVTADAMLRGALGTSAADKVIVGKDGWLFYSGTLDDYLGTSGLTYRELDNIAFDLSLMQGFCKANGANFCVVLPPSKNAVHPDKMPYYYEPASDRDVLSELASRLDEKHVNYVDAYQALKALGEDSYYRKDTHWTQLGALVTAEEALEALGQEGKAETLSQIQPSGKSENVGDLSKMLYPAAPGSEAEPSYEGSVQWELVEGANTVNAEESTWMEAKGEGDGTLFMYRDSFAKNMVPFLSSVFSESYYRWQMPWDMTAFLKYHPTDVIVERAARNLGELASAPAVMPAPKSKMTQEEIDAVKSVDSESQEEVSVSQDGNMTVIEGCLPVEFCNYETEEILVMVEKGDESSVYVPFRVTIDGDEFGYRAYLYNSTFEGATRVSVLASSTSGVYNVATLAI